jgi:hypothetical protein
LLEEEKDKIKKDYEKLWGELRAKVKFLLISLGWTNLEINK